MGDFDILDAGSKDYLDVLTPQKARIWVGVFVLGWDNERIAKALNINPKTVRSGLNEARKVIADDLSIAYRSIKGIA